MALAKPFSSTIVLCCVTAFSLLLAACSASPENAAGVDNPFTAEDERRFKGLTEQQLYESARASMQKQNYGNALDFYGRLEALYPFSPFARQAQLETIYANYKSDRREATIALADRFIKQHPRHPEIDYAYYIRGLANFDQAFENLESIVGERGETRDPAYARSAFSSFALLIRGYPTSAYAPDARKRMIFLKNRLAEYELSIAQFYLSRGAWMASANRAKTILEEYQGTTAVADALVIQSKAYGRLGMADLAEDAKRVLALNYPDYQSRQQGSWLASLNPFADDEDDLDMPASIVKAKAASNSNEERYPSLKVID